MKMLFFGFLACICVGFTGGCFWLMLEAEFTEICLLMVFAVMFIIAFMESVKHLLEAIDDYIYFDEDDY